MSNITTLIVLGAVMFAVLGGITLLSHIYSLNNIKSKTVGDGQHGTDQAAVENLLRIAARDALQPPVTSFHAKSALL